MRFDLLIRGGTLIDGSRAPRRRADLGIRGDRVAAIGDLSAAEASRTINAAGRIVAPGFIDVHNHSDGWLLRGGHFTAKTTQGFTTELLMSDGISYAPVDEHTAREWLFYLRSLNALRLDEYEGWESLADYLRLLDRRSVQNAAVQVPYANVRSMVCGFGRAAVDDVQQRLINAEIRRGMEAGAVGLSTGLDYIVQCFTTTDELVEACRVAAEFGGVYVTHMRYKRGMMAALAEAVEIGRRSGVKVHISHLKQQAAAPADEILNWIDTFARHEVDFSFDVYPYQPGSSMLNSLLPYEVWEGGAMAAVARLGEPRVRALFRANLEAHRVPLERLRIAWVASRENARHQGRWLADYIAETGQSVEDALADLLIEERLAVTLVFDEGDDALARPFLKHDLFMMGSDGIYFEDGHVHPRVYGSAGRLLGPCVRDLKLFSLEEAVWKLSGHAAQRFGFAGRGILREGSFADVVVFDPETVTDRATYENPHQQTTGISHVLVNGTVVIADERPVDVFPAELPGRALRFGAETD
jgi:N-acyl-D-amino-acid deacylase